MKWALAVAACVSLASARLHTNLKVLEPPPVDEVALDTEQSGSGVFQQLLDHDHPELGTFNQTFWWNAEYWAGEGSPVVLFTPGEAAAAGYVGYLTNSTLTGLYAQEIGGAVVMLEHRYYGSSSPYAELTTKNMQYLTLKNAIADLTHLARTVSLPFDPKGTSHAPGAPWVLSGGSYSGALAAWTESTSPGTFWAYHASSAPVQAIDDFWQYFVPVQEGMAQNCSKDVSLVIDHVDSVLRDGSSSDKQTLKQMFGLEAVTHDDDFAAALTNGPWLWQENSFSTGYSGFFQFCDQVEGVYNTGNSSNSTYPTANPGPEGVGLEKALAGYASWMKNSFAPGYCANSFGYWTDKNDLGCFSTYNTTSPLYTDRSVGNAVNLQWNWMLCNEPFAYWQDGAPTSRPSIVSRLVDAPYWQRQCSLFFPQEGNYTFGSSSTAAHPKTVDDVNAFTGGWSAKNSTRVLWANGEFDPWRSTSTSSEFRPDGPLESTAAVPVNIIPGGFHCSDLQSARNGGANAGVQAIIEKEVATIAAWVKEFPGYGKKAVKAAAAAVQQTRRSRVHRAGQSSWMH